MSFSKFLDAVNCVNGDQLLILLIYAKKRVNFTSENEKCKFWFMLGAILLISYEDTDGKKGAFCHEFVFQRASVVEEYKCTRRRAGACSLLSISSRKIWSFESLLRPLDISCSCGVMGIFLLLELD